MTTHRDIADGARTIRGTLYLITGFYVAIGFLLAAACAFKGDRFGTLIGFLVITGSIVAAVTLRSLLRTSVRVSASAEKLEEIEQRIASIDRHLRTESARRAIANEDELRQFTLLGTGGGVEKITAGALHLSTFPRLVRAADLEHTEDENKSAAASAGATAPSAKTPTTSDSAVSSPHETAPSETEFRASARAAAQRAESPPHPTNHPVQTRAAATPTGLNGHEGRNHEDAEVFSDHNRRGPANAATSTATARNEELQDLLTDWQTALEEQSLPDCRQILPALNDIADPRTLRTCAESLTKLETQTEHTLREAFTRAATTRNRTAMIEAAQNIITAFPNSPLAEEANRIATLLQSPPPARKHAAGK